jgi:hypothetical protein
MSLKVAVTQPTEIACSNVQLEWLAKINSIAASPNMVERFTSSEMVARTGEPIWIAEMITIPASRLQAIMRNTPHVLFAPALRRTGVTEPDTNQGG